MPGKSSPSKVSSCPCFAGNTVAAAFLLITTIVAAVDLVMAHTLSGGFVFGTSGASLSVLAFVVSFLFFYKFLKKALGCCCCGSGGCGR